MNCIICADKISCSLLEGYARKYSSLNLIGTFSDSATIRNQLLENHEIELVILDIDLSKIDVFNIINSQDFKPNIIIVSSGDQYALKAFDFNVVDYLLKPVTYLRFCKAVDKAIKYYSHKDGSNSISNEIFIKKGSLLVKLKLKDILYIEALENYIILNTPDQKFTIHFTMKAMENYLPAGIFIRVHRSFIVNKSLIQTIKENSLELNVGKDLKTIPVGNSFRDYLLNSISMMAKL
jgi:DNA-binding LytR/AlgR family response regulator